MSFRIALAQIAPRLGDIRGNVEKHLEQIEAARTAGAHVLLFPELSVVGNALGDLSWDVALGPDANEIAEIRRASREIAIGVGIIERSVDRLFRNAYLYLEGGTVRHIHRKVHLSTDGHWGEHRLLAAGSRFAAFDTRRGRLGILLGDDARHLPAASVLALDRVDAIVTPVAVTERPTADRSPARDFTVWSEALAATTRSYVFAINRTGSEEGHLFAGQSRIVGPDGTIVASANAKEERLVVGEFDHEALRRARRTAPGPRDLRRDVVLSEMRRLGGEC